MPNGVDVLEAARIKGAGDNKFKLLACHLMQEAACQPRRQLRCRHDLQTVLAIACGGRAAGGECQPALDDNGPPHHHCHVPISGNNLIKEADHLNRSARQRALGPPLSTSARNTFRMASWFLVML